MKDKLANIIKSHRIISALCLVLIFVLMFLSVRYLTYTRIKIKFTDLRPFHGKAAVYFKGFKIGRVTKIAPADDYQSTIVSVIIYPIKTKLPTNTTAKLKVHKTRWFHKDYIDLIYPESPDLTYLKNGSVIDGKSSIDINSYMANISPETYEKMEANAANIMENLDGTTGLLFSIFGMIQGILEESDSSIKNSISNLEKTSSNTSLLTQKINKSISEQQLQSVIGNITDTSANVKIVTAGLNGTTTHINKTIPNFNNTLSSINSITNNVNEITCGVKHTMRKSFGGLRLFFGRPIPKNCQCR